MVQGCGIRKYEMCIRDSPRRERQLNYKGSWDGKIFQSTLPRRERHMFEEVPVDAGLFQSTLPRRERPSVVVSWMLCVIISIHAPA